MRFASVVSAFDWAWFYGTWGKAGVYRILDRLHWAGILYGRVDVDLVGRQVFGVTRQMRKQQLDQIVAYLATLD